MKTALERWNSNEEAVSSLDNFLSGPAGQLFLEVLREGGAPTIVDPNQLPGEGETLLTRMALSHSSINGYHACINNIMVLASPIQEVRELTHSEWERPDDKSIRS